jgi:hypothetical protein
MARGFRRRKLKILFERKFEQEEHRREGVQEFRRILNFGLEAP